VSKKVETLALIGTGIMGAGMGRNLVEAGLSVRAWNRTREKADAIEGAVIADSPAAAATGADAVMTMVTDKAALRSVMTDEDGALAAMDEDAVWIQSSTIGIEGTAEMAALADEAGRAFVDAPVLGTRKPAEEGKLVVLASGDAEAIARAEPVFNAIGAKLVELGDEPGAASRMKVAVNAWLLTLNVNVAETLAFAEALGVDPAKVLEILDGNPVGSPYAQLKGKAILGRDYEPASFPLAIGAKDLGLVLEAAAGAGIDLALAPAAKRRFEEALEMGHGELDMAAVYEAVGARSDDRPAAAP
jgi:3-hydroxyisobutyrate dehydrogenase